MNKKVIAEVVMLTILVAGGGYLLYEFLKKRKETNEDAELGDTIEDVEKNLNLTTKNEPGSPRILPFYNKKYIAQFHDNGRVFIYKKEPTYKTIKTSRGPKKTPSGEKLVFVSKGSYKEGGKIIKIDGEADEFSTDNVFKTLYKAAFIKF